MIGLSNIRIILTPYWDWRGMVCSVYLILYFLKTATIQIVVSGITNPTFTDGVIGYRKAVSVAGNLPGLILAGRSKFDVGR